MFAENVSRFAIKNSGSFSAKIVLCSNDPTKSALGLPFFHMAT
jgi:hypothetical protein